MFNFESLKKYSIKRTFKESIEPEEIFLDTAKPELEGQKIEVAIRPRIFKIFFGLVIFCLIILLGQAFYLQIIKKNYYQSLAEHNRLRVYPTFAPRGIIYDRFLKQLVYNIPSFDLVFNPQDLSKDFPKRTEIVEKVAKILGISSGDIINKINEHNLKNNQTILIADDLSQEKVLVLEPEMDKLTGFRIEKNATRQYVFAPYFSHIFGYLGKLNSEDFKNNPDYFLTEKIGKAGLESFYEKTLRGEPGKETFEVDALGEKQRILGASDPVAGEGLVLNIDNELQRKLYDSLNKTLGDLGLRRAAAVAFNPQTGGVLALVSLPSFDNNLFSKTLSLEEYTDLARDPTKPFFNRAIAGQYPPGSTIKPLVGLAALQEKVVDAKTTIFDSGEISVANQFNPEIIYRFTDWSAHGLVNIFSAIAQSCDVYFYTVGGGYGKIGGLGIERLEKYFKLFGLGNILGIDLEGEKSGLVPDPQWKEDVKKEAWYLGDTYHISIGQGDLLVTPLQLAIATAAVANNGKIISPRLVDKIIDSDKNIIKSTQPKILAENFIDAENIEIVKEAMRQAVTDGSAGVLSDLKISVAAKTGTAQIAGQKNPNAWLTVFAPYQNPEIVLVILVENAGEGSKIAAPIAREVLDWYFSRKF